MMISVLIVLVIIIVLVGTLYLHLHSIPEKVAHGKEGVHFELVAVLALVALFTHNNVFWVAALVLAFVPFPNLASPLTSIASSLKTIALSKVASVPEPAVSSPPAQSIAPSGGTEAVSPDMASRDATDTEVAIEPVVSPEDKRS
ncbi:hypothetical protein SAMN06265374_4456 [Roseibium denhamense]|uniref:Uncharacterized protein n=2 Tax=Roseibium denhamense TaxID=76305 RepID=A0ABY1PQ99_9HYPH|nr:hypothetical protein SAMN06265374_4456 [Roseibium denhamense]